MSRGLVLCTSLILAGFGVTRLPGPAESGIVLFRLSLTAALIQRADLAHLLRLLAEEQQQWLVARVTRRRQLLTMLHSEYQRLQITPAGLLTSTRA